MNLFGKLGVKHSIMFDSDSNSERHAKINEFLQKNKNRFISKFYLFPNEFEDFLGIPKESEGYNILKL